MEKKEDVKPDNGSRRKIVGYRYMCTRTCFFDGRRVFVGKSIVREQKLAKEQAAHFKPAIVLYAEETVEDDE